MHLYEFEGKRPTVHPDAFVAPTATLIGDVTVEKGASVWYGAVLRGDGDDITVGHLHDRGPGGRQRAGQLGHPRRARPDR